MSFVCNHNFQRVKYFYITAHSFYLDLGKSQTSQCNTASHASHAESFLQWNPPVQSGSYCLVLRGLHGNPWFGLGMSKPLLALQVPRPEAFGTTAHLLTQPSICFLLSVTRWLTCQALSWTWLWNCLDSKIKCSARKSKQDPQKAGM